MSTAAINAALRALARGDAVKEKTTSAAKATSTAETAAENSTDEPVVDLGQGNQGPSTAPKPRGSMNAALRALRRAS